MALELFDYQKEGVKWLTTKKVALLADEQRLGKSAQVIRAAEQLGAKRVVVVCKAVARANWCFEFAKFATKSWDTTPLHTLSFQPFELKENQVIIVSYEATSTLLEKLQGDFDILVVDEAHSIKNIKAKRTQNILGAKGLCRRTKRTWLLTGTPCPNNASELWPMLYTFGATPLSYFAFVDKFCVTVDSGFGLQIVGTKTDSKLIGELRQILSKVMLRRTAAEVSIQLPKIHFSTVMVDPGRVDFLAHKHFARFGVSPHATQRLNEIIEQETGIVNAILKDNKMSDQLLEVLKAQSGSISTLKRYAGLQKLDPAIEIIREELTSGAYRKVVLFAHHRDTIEGARARLLDFFPVVVYGGSNPANVEKNLKRFNDPDSKYQVFIGQIQAAGTSISLAVANHIFFLEQDWVPGNNAQAMMRCGGVNQKKPIFCRNFCLTDSIDKRIQELLRKKTLEIAQVLNDPKLSALQDLL